METNNSLLNLKPATLRRAADLKERIDALNSELASILGGAVSLNPQPLPPKNGRKGGRRTMSAAGKARIAAAARLRWAKYNAAKGKGAADSAASKPAGKRKMSAAGRAKIAAAARARWAKAKAAGKNSL